MKWISCAFWKKPKALPKSSRMKLVVGLGNPGKEYAHNRHNIGFLCIEQLAKKLMTSPKMKEKGKKPPPATQS